VKKQAHVGFAMIGIVTIYNIDRVEALGEPLLA
jgi:hypothetical protein